MSTFLAKKLLAGVVGTGLTAAAATAGPAGGAVYGTAGHSVHPVAYHTAGHTSGAYHLTHGRAFAGGYCYPGRNHSHWTYSGYSKRYGCTCYWCPSTCQYYYWCQSADCYYPVSYITTAPPVAYTPPVAYVRVPVVVRTVAVPAPTPPCCHPRCQAPTPYPYPAPAAYPSPSPTQVQGPPVGVPPLPQ